MEQWLLDWPNLARYRQADAEVSSSEAKDRVVFMGDSITDAWKLDASFPGRNYVNRGISGQTTSQMLVRFQQDVVNLRPAAVVILAGTNDIAGNSGPVSVEDIENNFRAMVAIANANKIAVVVAAVTPVHNYTERSQRFYRERPMEKIRALNDWLKDSASTYHYRYVDDFTPLLDEKGLLKRELADDGLHPNATGYEIMAKLFQAAIEKSLKH